MTDKLKGYDIKTVWTEEIIDKLRATRVNPHSSLSNPYWGNIHEKSYIGDWKGIKFKKLEIPKADFFATVDPGMLEKLLHECVFGEKPNSGLLILYFRVKEANEKAKARGFLQAI